MQYDLLAIQWKQEELCTGRRTSLLKITHQVNEANSMTLSLVVVSGYHT